MDTHERWRALLAVWPWSVRSSIENQESERHSAHELHQQRLKCLLTQGLPCWSEELPFCDACGRQLLVGERAAIVRGGDELVLCCPLCKERLLAAGCLMLPVPQAKPEREERPLVA